MEQVNRSTWFRTLFASVLPVLGRLALGLGLSFTGAFAVQDSLEYKVKAAFLLNFVKFTDWPASAFAAPIHQSEFVSLVRIRSDPPWMTSSLVKP